MTNQKRRDESQPKSGRRLLEDRRHQKRWDGQERRTQAEDEQSAVLKLLMVCGFNQLTIYIEVITQPGIASQNGSNNDGYDHNNSNT